jgi:hypothetical protein
VEEPWADVWVRWRERPGRVRAFGPTLMARADVAGEVRKWQWCLQHYARHLAGETLEIPNREMLECSREELPQAVELLRRLDAEGWIFDRDPAERTPNLYTIRPWLTRATAEELLAKWLELVHGIHHPKFEWDRPKIFVRSM